jgi:hypothetical protein
MLVLKLNYGCDCISYAIYGNTSQGVASRKPSSNKAEAAQQLLATYEAILAHLRAHGALVNAVKPEYLLEPADFELLMEARSASAAGNPEQETAQELWAPVEQSFGEYSARAWNCVLLQVRWGVVLTSVCRNCACMQVNSLNTDVAFITLKHVLFVLCRCSGWLCWHG